MNEKEKLKALQNAINNIKEEIKNTNHVILALERQIKIIEIQKLIKNTKYEK
jgi:hypothetical protein